MMMRLLVCAVLLSAWAPNADAASAACTRPATYGELAERALGRSLLAKRKFKLIKPKGGNKRGCSSWKVGTATGYSTDGTDQGDLPMAPNDLGEWQVPGKFFRKHNVIAVDGGDWGSDKYRTIEIALEGKVGKFEVWDLCADKDCSRDNPACCSTNKRKYSSPGYLLDIETHAAKRVWGLKDAQNWLVAPVYYRVCGKFDKKKLIREYKMKCMGLKGDGKCSK